MTSTTNCGRTAAACLSLVASLFISACSGADTANAAANEALIRKLTSDWAAAEVSNNVDSALAFLWDDATMQPPNAAAV